MSTELFRKYIDILNEAEEVGGIVSQQELMAAYEGNPVKPKQYKKAQIEAIIPKNSQLGQKMNQYKGKVDAAKYNEEHPYIVIQGLMASPYYDIYTNKEETVRNTKIPVTKPDLLLVKALKALGVSLKDLQTSGGGLFVKKDMPFLIPAKALNVEGKTIDAGWGTQVVKPGGYLVLEGYPNVKKIYCINADANGLPIGYIPA